MFQQAVDNSALAFTYCLHRTSRSTRSESFLRSFLGMCSALHVHVDFKIPKNISELFKASWTHSPDFSFQNLRSASSLPQLVLPPQEAVPSNSDCFQWQIYALKIGLFLLSKLWVRSKKGESSEWGFSRDMPDRSNSDLRMGLWGSPQTVLPGWGAASFHN